MDRLCLQCDVPLRKVAFKAYNRNDELAVIACEENSDHFLLRRQCLVSFRCSFIGRLLHIF